MLDYMDRVKRCSAVPVCAGFGIRLARRSSALRRTSTGWWSARPLVEALERGEDVRAFLGSLRREPAGSSIEGGAP